MSRAAKKQEAQAPWAGWCDKHGGRGQIVFKCRRCRARVCTECAETVEVKDGACIPCQLEEDYPEG